MQFIGTIVSQSGSWMSPIHASLHVASHLSPRFPAFRDVFNSLVSQFVTQSGWWFPARWLSVFTCLPSLVSQSGWCRAALLMFLFYSLVSLQLFFLCFVVPGSSDSFLYLIPFMSSYCPLCLPCLPEFVPEFVPQFVTQFVAQFVSQFVSQCVPPCLSLRVSQFCLFQQGPGHWNFVSYSGLPVVSHNRPVFPVIFKVSSSGLPNVFHLSPSCLRVDVISQLPSNCLSLVSRFFPSGLPNLSWMWFPDVVPQLPQGFSTCRLCVPLASQMWFPTCCLPVRLLFSCRPPRSQMVSQLSPRCLPDTVA